MKLFSAPVLLACACCLFSCGSKNADPQTLIVAKWNLKKDHVVEYRDSVVLLDTTLYAANATQGTTQFNNDGSYTSTATYFTGKDSVLITKIPTSSMSVSGTYAYSDNTFTVSRGLAGWYLPVIGGSGMPTEHPYAAKITSLTSSELIINTNQSVTIPQYPNSNPTFTQTNDLYYTR